MRNAISPARRSNRQIVRVTSLEVCVGAIFALLAAGCGDTSSPNEPQPSPVVWSWNDLAARTVRLRYLLPISVPDCATDSVTVTGPGIPSSLTLGCVESRGEAFFGEVDFGGGWPALPLAYHFRATLGGVTTTQVAEVDCTMPLPVGISPATGAGVSSPVTLRWTKVGATGIRYGASVSLGATKVSEGFVVDEDSLRVTLAPGSYEWQVVAEPSVGSLYDGTSDTHCGASWGGGSFMVN